jgi:hypothetical protein
MNRWRALVSLLMLLFIGLLAYLGYYAFQLYSASQETTPFIQRYSTSSSDNDADHLKSLLDDCRRLQAKHDTLQMRLALFDLDLRYAQRVPAHSLEPLREAMRLGRQLYVDFSTSTTPDPAAAIGINLSGAYLLSGLPQEVKRWDGELIPKAPQMRFPAHLREAVACLQLDDPAGARALVRQDLQAYGGQPDARALAMAIYTLLHDYRSASESERDMNQLVKQTDTDPNYFWIYGSYLISKGRFPEAEKVLETGAAVDPDDPSIELELATAQTARLGLSAAQVQDALRKLGGDPRLEESADGLAADTAAWLWHATGQPQWWTQLCTLALQHERDPDVLTALAQGWASLAPSDALRQTTALPQAWDHPLGPADAAAALAASPAARRRALFAVVEAACVPDADGKYPPGSAAHAVDAFNLALGDPGRPSSLQGEEMPDYTDLLLSDAVKQRRSAEPAFNQDMHRAIIDLLNRRQDLFHDILPLEPLKRDAAPRPLPPGAD